MKRILFAAAVLVAGCGDRSYGRVWITNAVASQPAELSAVFGGAAPLSPSRNPAFGDCYVTTTSTDDHYASAGTLEVSGPGGPWQLAPTSKDAYNAKPNVTWTPSTSLTIQASGGDVPPFTGTFIIPPPFVYTNENLLAAIANDDDVVLSWNPIDAQNIWVGVQSGSAEVSCSFNAKDGTGTIPGAALATLPASRTINSVACKSSQLQLGNWWINLIAQSRAQLADGSVL